MQQQAFFQQCARDYVVAAQTISASWAMFMPVPSAITGLGDTINDESLNSAPDTQPARDVMAVGKSGDVDHATAGGDGASQRVNGAAQNRDKQVAA